MTRFARRHGSALRARLAGFGAFATALALHAVFSGAASAACLGDCNGNGAVTAGELTKIISIINLCGGTAAGCPAVPGTDKQCTNADKNGNSTISAGELTNIIFNIINFTGGCPAATPTPTASPTPAGPPLGRRVFSFSANSGFWSSLLPTAKVGTPAGTMNLDAGPLDAGGRATVVLAEPIFVKTSLPAGNLTMCTKIESCTGTLNCNGGANVDVRVELNSLAAGLTCVRDGTKSCPNQPTSVCCSNACEGVGVGSGNEIARTGGVNPGTDSGAGAMILTCTQRVIQIPLNPGNCAAADYSTANVMNEMYTTGSSTAYVPNHCADPTGAPANKVPTFGKSGENFNCANWTTENSPGKLAYSIPAEEGSSIIKGDGAQAGIYADP